MSDRWVQMNMQVRENVAAEIRNLKDKEGISYNDLMVSFLFLYKTIKGKAIEIPQEEEVSLSLLNILNGKIKF
jgi:hypothetical protein